MDTTQQVIWAKLESVYGTDPVPTATDAILVEGFASTRSNTKIVERAPIEASKGTRQKIFAASLYDVTFSMEVKGSGTGGVPPECGVPWQACAVSEFVIGSAVWYGPLNSGHKSITIYRFIDGKLHKFTGVRGSFAYKANVHEIPMIEFTLVGHMTESDVAIGSATYDGAIPLPVLNVTVKKDTVLLPAVKSFIWDNTSEVKIPTDLAVYDGFGEIVLGKRNPKGTLVLEDGLIATRDWKAILESNTPMVIQLAFLGGSAGQRHHINMLSVSLTGDAEGEDENKVTRALEFEAHAPTAVDDWLVVFD